MHWNCRNAQGRPDLAAAKRLAAEESKSKNKMCGVYFECGARNVSFGTVAKDKVVTGGGSSISSDRSTSKRLRFIMPVSLTLSLCSTRATVCSVRASGCFGSSPQTKRHLHQQGST